MSNEIGLIIDLDGTMYQGKQMIPYADRFIQTLRERDIRFLFLTNNSSRPPEQVADHLGEMGIPATKEEIYTAAIAAARYIKRQKNDAIVYVVGEGGLVQAIREEGLRIVEDESTEQPDFVVQGIDRQFTYDRMARAVQFIRDGAAYVQTNPDLLLPTDGGFIPGAGSIGAAIQAASGAVPVVIGKPSTIIMNDAISILGLPAERIWVVGDNVSTDIKAGVMAGCRTALPLTGLTTRDNLEEMLERAGVTPDLTGDDLASLLDDIFNTRI